MKMTTRQKLETLAGEENGFGYYLSESKCRKAGKDHIDMLHHCRSDEKGIALVKKFGGWHRVDLSYPAWHFHRNVPNSRKHWTKEYSDFFDSQIGKGQRKASQ